MFSIFAVNWWAVLVSGVAYFVIGAVWYGIFGTAWMKGIGKTRDQIQQNPVQYIVSLVAEIGVAVILAVVFRAFGALSPDLPFGVFDGIFVATLMWGAFSLLPAIVHYAYEGKTFSLLVINKGYDFLGFNVAAIILTVWK